MLNDSSDGSGVNPSSEMLVHISEILKLSIDDFYDKKYNAMSYNYNVLKLLSKIDDAKDRMKVLIFIHTIADKYPDYKDRHSPSVCIAQCMENANARVFGYCSPP